MIPENPTGHTLFPYVQDTLLFCDRCGIFVTHRQTAYPDEITTICAQCGTRRVTWSRWRPAHADDTALQAQLREVGRLINALAGQLQNREWGNLGKKDRDFLTHFLSDLVYIQRKTKC